MASKKKEVTRLWISRYRLRGLPAAFAALVAGTPFEGSRLVFTGNVERTSRTAYGTSLRPNRYEFEVVPTVDTYEPIPGYRFSGYVETENDGKNYTLHRLDAEFEFTKEIADSLDPRRCDVCNVRHRRKRQFLLVEKDTGNLVAVGGACARKFKGVDLEEELKKAFVFTKTVTGSLDEDSLWTSGGYGHDPVRLSEGIAVAEVIIKSYGYTSQKTAVANDSKAATSYWLETYFRERRKDGRNDDDWDRVQELVGKNRKAVRARILELEETEFGALREWADDQLAVRWNEFNNNIVAWLNGSAAVKSWGITAYLGTLQSRIDGESTEAKGGKTKKEKLPVKGFRGGPIGKVADWGEVRVVSVKLREGSYGYTYGFTCVRETDTSIEKLWFKVGEDSQAFRLWEQESACDIDLTRNEVFVTLRGKLTDVNDDIAFGKLVKFKSVRHNAPSGDTE